jgi:DnaJ domain
MNEDVARRILGLGAESEPSAVDAAYRRLARRFHPDVNREPDAQERMRDVNRAYEVLRESIRKPGRGAVSRSVSPAAFWTVGVPEQDRQEDGQDSWRNAPGLPRGTGRLVTWALLLAIGSALAVITFKSGVLTLGGAALVLGFLGRRVLARP